MIETIKKKISFLYKLNELFSNKEKFQFLGIVGASLLMAIFQAMGVASILPFINLVMNPTGISENKWLSYFYNLFEFGSVDSFIIFSGFAVIGLLVIGNSVSALATWLKVHFVWKKNHSLSTALLQKYISMPYVYFLEQNTSNLGKNVLAEVLQLTRNFLLPIVVIITDGLVILAMLILLCLVNFLMTVIAATVLISLYILIYLYYSEKLKIGGARRLKKNEARFKSASEALGGIKDAKVLGAENFFLKRFCEDSDEFSNLQAWYQTINQVPKYIMEIVAFGGVVGLLIFLVASDIATHDIIPLVSFFAFAGYRLMPSLQSVFNSFTTFKFNIAVLDKIHNDLINEKLESDEISIRKKRIIPLNFKSSIKLEKIYFSYPQHDNPILRDINLEIKKNNFVALIGTTGSGKTTLVDLILGLLTPQKGLFMVDDQKVTKENIKNWQANLGYVPQQIYLSDDSISRNIAFGLPDDKIDMEKIKKVSKMANIHDFIDSELPEGYHTIIGERGVRLSGGQRQRIGIARALYHDPQILIFDEATSSLDNETEKEVLKAIHKVFKFKTLIVIAHRLSTVKEANKVYLIEKGKIVDSGSYEKMVKKKIKLGTNKK
jgi:ATP-binding cassette subfamily C protein